MGARRRTGATFLGAALAAACVGGPARAEDEGPKFRFAAEVRLNVRSSRSVEYVEPIPQGFDVAMRTVSPGGSLELSNVALTGEATFTPDLSARLKIHFLDLYSRNPTSTDDRVFIREAWVRWGKKYEALQPLPGSSFYVQAGKAPRFTRQNVRRLDSYGLWGTAVGRFEEVGLEAGGSFGKRFYWRLAAASSNPLFMRDPNALAGDNGTAARIDFDDLENSVYESGFPILYDAKADDLSVGGNFQGGAGLGWRLVSDDGRRGVDVLLWAFQRSLLDKRPIRGSLYHGDLDLFEGLPPIGLPTEGRRKREVGANVEARWERVTLFAQFVRQDIAGLARDGVEAEVAWRIPLNGLFASGDTVIGNWVQPALRLSTITNRFESPEGFIAPSFAWDWRKYDFAVRLGIMRGIDLTAEYARNDVVTDEGTIHPDEFLMTLRVSFSTAGW